MHFFRVIGYSQLTYGGGKRAPLRSHRAHPPLPPSGFTRSAPPPGRTRDLADSPWGEGVRRPKTQRTRTPKSNKKSFLLPFSDNDFLSTTCTYVKFVNTAKSCEQGSHRGSQPREPRGGPSEVRRGTIPRTRRTSERAPRGRHPDDGVGRDIRPRPRGRRTDEPRPRDPRSCRSLEFSVLPVECQEKRPCRDQSHASPELGEGTVRSERTPAPPPPRGGRFRHGEGTPAERPRIFTPSLSRALRRAHPHRCSRRGVHRAPA